MNLHIRFLIMHDINLHNCMCEFCLILVTLIFIEFHIIIITVLH